MRRHAIVLGEQAFYSLRSMVLLLGVAAHGFDESLGSIAVSLAVFIALVATVTGSTGEILFSQRSDDVVSNERSACLSASGVGGVIACFVSFGALLALRVSPITAATMSLSVAAGAVAETRRLLLLRTGHPAKALVTSVSTVAVLAVGLAVGPPHAAWLIATTVSAVAFPRTAPTASIPRGLAWVRRRARSSSRSAVETFIMMSAGQSSTLIASIGLSIGDAGILRALQALFGPATVGVSGSRLALVSRYHHQRDKGGTWLPRRPAVAALLLVAMALALYTLVLVGAFSQLSRTVLSGAPPGARSILLLLGIQLLTGVPGVIVPAWLRLNGRFGVVLGIRVVTAGLTLLGLALGTITGSIGGMVGVWMIGSTVSAALWLTTLLVLPHTREMSWNHWFGSILRPERETQEIL